jgi:hypothetical protein
MKSILNNLGIDETYTKEVKKPKYYTRINDNIPHKADWNFMADLIEMPLTKNKNKYILVCVDLATREFDIEPIKNKEPKTILQAFKSMFKRSYIKEPKYSMSTDGGSEFKGDVAKWLYEKSIYHKVASKDRHSQQSMVETLNKQLERLFNGYMNKVEEQTKQIYNEWDIITDVVRTELNKIRKVEEVDPVSEVYPTFKGVSLPKFKVGDIVYRQSDVPLNALGHEQNIKKWRVGDYRFEKIPKKITKVLYFSGNVPYRYMLKGVPLASYTEAQLLKAEDEPEEKYIIREIIGKKILNKKPQYLIWWRGYLKKEATWVDGDSLIEDGHKDLIDAFKKK